MPRLLRIDSSSRREGSHSRQLADRVQAKWLQENPRGQVLVRDLASAPIPHISEATISAFFTPKQQHSVKSRKAAALSDELIGELLAADALLISVPIYNFSIPSALKAYIDHVVRIDHTFAFDPQKGLHGLIGNKRAFVAAAYGAAG